MQNSILRQAERAATRDEPCVMRALIIIDLANGGAS